MAQLSQLWLQGNQIGDAGVSALAGVCAGEALAQLQVNSRLTTLLPRPEI